jgi:2,3,4,5-tetrahydropyridine-2-carboxylate N-succinyltransferase
MAGLPLRIPFSAQPVDKLRSVMSLQEKIEQYFAAGASAADDSNAMGAFLELRAALEAGEIRAAEPDASAPTGWRVNAWVKRGILLGFRLGQMEGSGCDEHASLTSSVRASIPSGSPEGSSGLFLSSGFSFVDKHTYPARRFMPEQGIRVVPGGSSVRAGAFLAKGVVAMPPMYVNVGAYVDEGTMIDSHALVGSCAQLGKRVHLSAASQVGGVLEPVNASPVVLEDDVLVGGNCGVYEGTIVRRRAVLAAGTVLTRGTPVYDVVRGEVLRADAGQPLIIPEGAVVVPGARAVGKGKGQEWGLSVYTPVIVKYRDEKTELSLALEDLLR